jgi:hypothetical protein
VFIIHMHACEYAYVQVCVYACMYMCTICIVSADVTDGGYSGACMRVCGYVCMYMRVCICVQFVLCLQM